eukprot:scaffold12381_cov63-Phaeocystis_antarctica.AAC.3
MEPARVVVGHRMQAALALEESIPHHHRLRERDRLCVVQPVQEAAVLVVAAPECERERRAVELGEVESHGT